MAGLALLLWSLTPLPTSAQLDRLRHPPTNVPPSRLATAMITIPAGSFRMGIDGMAGLEDERPAHAVWLDAFLIDAVETTTARYAAFLAATGHPAPEGWETVVVARHGEKPVVGVSWDDARRFCEWEGKRLPTEAEWERAARGTDEQRYPWGTAEPTRERANIGLGARFSYDQVLMAVGTYPLGVSAEGVHDLAGNVGEWVQDWYAIDYYEGSPRHNPTGPAEGSFKVVRGGSWSDLAKYALTYARAKLPPETRNSFTGIRCAQSVRPLPAP